MSNVFAIRAEGSLPANGDELYGNELADVAATLGDLREQLSALEARVIRLWRAALEQRDEPRLAQLVQLGTALGLAGNALTLERLVGAPRRLI